MNKKPDPKCLGTRNTGQGSAEGSLLPRPCHLGRGLATASSTTDSDAGMSLFRSAKIQVWLSGLFPFCLLIFIYFPPLEVHSSCFCYFFFCPLVETATSFLKL